MNSAELRGAFTTLETISVAAISVLISSLSSAIPDPDLNQLHSKKGFLCCLCSFDIKKQPFRIAKPGVSAVDTEAMVAIVRSSNSGDSGNGVANALKTTL